MKQITDETTDSTTSLQDMHSIEWQIDVITAAIFRLEETLRKEDPRWRAYEPFHKVIQNPKHSMYSVYNKLGALSDEEIRMIQALRETG